MRQHFARLIKKEMENDERVNFLTADLGYGLFNDFEDRFPNSYHNVGASEQLLIGAGIGLSLGGKIPVCYSITPFLLCRPFEFIRNYIDFERIPVKLVGAGRGRDYGHDGFSHWADDDEKIMSVFGNIRVHKPEDELELEKIFQDFLYDSSPSYLNLKR
jgi:transketolase